MEKSKKVIIYTDGGARGNPGPAAIGVVMGEKHFAEQIGKATNNVAEYSAVTFALKKAKQLLGKEKAKQSIIEIRSDSELIVRQMNGIYKIKESALIPFFIEAWNAKQDFGKVSFVEIPREENKIADCLVNETLDGKGKNSTLFG